MMMIIIITRIKTVIIVEVGERREKRGKREML